MFRYGPHAGEEPPISGTRGSGTVFFGRCTLACLYCQNYPWSQEGRGELYDAGALAKLFETIHAQGCHNWNLVSPTPWWPQIREAIRTVRGRGMSLPVVVNTSGFERVEVLEELRDVADIYLTDLRYAKPETALEGSGSAAYPDAARDALRAMWRMAGPVKTDRDGIAVSGTICRVLVLPGRADEAVDTLRWMAGAIGTGVSLSLMAQYQPLYKAPAQPPWDRTVTRAEYEQVCEEADRLGFVEGWIQEYGGNVPDGLVGHRMQAVARETDG